jgi:hypothetical protein
MTLPREATAAGERLGGHSNQPTVGALSDGHQRNRSFANAPESLTSAQTLVITRGGTVELRKGNAQSFRDDATRRLEWLGWHTAC